MAPALAYRTKIGRSRVNMPKFSWTRSRLAPMLFEALAGYRRSDFVADLIAGVAGGILGLPLSMAFAIASGLDPQTGLYTGVVAGFIVAALGGTRYQIAGPTGAFVVIVAAIVSKPEFGFEGLLQCTFLAGLMLVAMGLTGLGAAVQYIPRPVTIGFTNGIAVIIASTQIRDFLGLAVDPVPSDFVQRLVALGSHLGTVEPLTAGMALATLVTMIAWSRVTPRIPAMIVALFLATLAVVVFRLDSIPTIGSRYGDIPSGFPSIRVPTFRFDHIVPMLPSALTIALLAAIQSLLSAAVAEHISGDRHKPDVELTAQGLANVVCPLFGGIPATGAIARTATNIRFGARSPVAGMLHAATLLAILLLFAPVFRFVPLSALAAAMLVVAYSMGEWRSIGPILHSTWADRLVWGCTFALTVFADLTVAVEIGMILAAMLYIRQVTDTTSVEEVSPEYLRDGKSHVLQDKPIPAHVTILRIHGPFLFGATRKLEEATKDMDHFNPVVILRLRNMTALDGTGVHAIEEFARRVVAVDKKLILCGARKQPAKLLRHSKLPDLIGETNMVPHVDAALARANDLASMPFRNEPGSAERRTPGRSNVRQAIAENLVSVAHALRLACRYADPHAANRHRWCRRLRACSRLRRCGYASRWPTQTSASLKPATVPAARPGPSAATAGASSSAPTGFLTASRRPSAWLASSDSAIGSSRPIPPRDRIATWFSIGVSSACRPARSTC